MINKRLYWIAAALTGLTLTGAGCGGGSSSDDDGGSVDSSTAPDAAPGPQTIRVNDDITQDTTWKGENTYIIPRLKQLFVEPGATLTIEPGTVIKGEQGSVLVITRGAKIHAVGTADSPIIFTSNEPDGSHTSGLWGGVLILGAAPINTNVSANPTSTEAVFEAFTGAIPEGKFGGTDAHDNSGEFEYVQIRFGGFSFIANREFNNLTLAGVGDGTTIDHIQVHRGKDDGIEFFGGTVNVKYLISSQNNDDGFDTDNGWQGKGQFIVVQHLNTDSTVEASNGYESDNHATAFTDAPRTLPTVSNVTVIGDDTCNPCGVGSFAAVLRRGTGGHYYNHIFYGFPQGLEVRDSATMAQVTAGNLFIKNSIFFHNDNCTNCVSPIGPGNDDSWPAPQASNDNDEQAIFMGDSSWGNAQTDPGLKAAAFDLRAPDFRPNTVTVGHTPDDDGFFDPTATFIGAMGTDDWSAGWTEYPQN